MSSKIIGAAIEVHKKLGPGLLETVYQAALAMELTIQGHRVEREVLIPVVYKGLVLDAAYRADIIVDDLIIIELKATENDNPLFYKQLYTYLKLADKRLGLLINFNNERLVDGVQRVVHDLW